MDASSLIFLAIYWMGIIIWSIKNKDEAKKELLQMKKHWKTWVIVTLFVLVPFLAVAVMGFIQ
ncbi:hypothetical protein [Peribacillus sp. SI8-4]|uniref:hypothetical protein n=1 Tax=Peribacillus sp. SI8-4 TaxID=3048009 RepID=UPI00255560C8|nr:hypothetical protein [Peribacillus sp. SI8-4]